MIRKICLATVALVLTLSLSVGSAFAQDGDVLGVHLLSPHDLEAASRLLDNNHEWKYLTIPLTLDDLNKAILWQDFFDQAKSQKMIPIVRLATRVEGDHWVKPSRWNIVQQIGFLNSLSWPTNERYVIIFNEVNHAKEWGGEIDPAEYAGVLRFASDWIHTEGYNYRVLPAAMDLAAPNGTQTMEAFNYLERMHQADSAIFDKVDIWNSHSYPNPGFSSAPTRSDKSSIRGFLHELSYLKRKTGRDYEVMITETGWTANRYTSPWLENYYLYAMQHVWSHPSVKAVTPFVVRGAPGPFTGFSFFDSANQPTVQFEALRNAWERWKSKN